MTMWLFLNYRFIKSQYIENIADKYLVFGMRSFVTVTYTPDFKDLVLLEGSFRPSWLLFSDL